ncbi:MAG: hypothetical protein ACJAVZ_001420 [Afipia broomeae]|jgi:hypothetical protein
MRPTPDGPPVDEPAVFLDYETASTDTCSEAEKCLAAKKQNLPDEDQTVRLSIE